MVWRRAADRLAKLRCAAPAPLALGQNALGSAGAAALFGSPLIAHLDHLDLWKNGITEDIVPVLAELPSLGRLRYLDITGESMTESAVVALSRLPQLRTVARFHASANAWQFPPRLRAELDERFGQGWYYGGYSGELDD